MIKKYLRSLLALSLVVGMILVAPLEADATDLSGLPGAAASGLKIIYSGSGDSYSASISGSTITASASGYRSFLSKKTSSITLTFTNTSSLPKTLTFTVDKTSTGGTVEVDSTTQSDNLKTYEMELAAETGTCTIKLTSKSGSGNTVSVDITNVVLKSNSTELVDVTFAAAENDLLGNSTGSCSQTGNTVSYEGDISGLTVTPATGYVFYGWKNAADGSILSTSVSGFIKPDAAITVYPYFVPKDTARFSVDGKTYYYWEDAFTAAKAGGKKVIVSSDGCLPGGKAFNKLGTYVTADSNGNITYIVPSDCYLTVPRTNGDSGTFGSADSFKNGDGQATPSAYQTFTVQSGAKIICNGNLNVNGQRRESGQGHAGQTMGTYGKMVLQGSGTQLEVNGTLYCYGYITGSGMVEVNGTIHEVLEMGCWNGGSQALAWKNAAGQDAIFMISQYFVQNVEAPLKLNGGATEILETAVTVGYSGLNYTVRKDSTFVASSDGLFHLPTGAYLLREHDLANDRVTYTLGSSDGQPKTVGFGSITIEASVLGGIIGATVTSSSYTLPIPNNMTMKIGKGITMSMDNRVAILPGASIIVDEGATVNMTNHLYIFGYDDWSGSMYYQTGSNYAEAAYYNTVRGTTRQLTINSSGRLQIDGTLQLTGNGNIYTTGTVGSTTNSDKVVYGKGTIIHEGTLSAGSLKTGYNGTLNPISMTNGMARLAGITNPNDLSTYAEMGNATYIGLGDAYNHFWYETKIDQTATCTQEGGSIYNVDGGIGLFIKSADKLPHNYFSEITDATCTENGSEVHTCSACGDKYTEVIVAIGHSYKSQITEATCTENGSEVHTCSACGDKYTEVIVAIGHKYVTVTIDATCTTDGSCTHTCSTCSDSYSEVLAALGHADCRNANGEEVADHFCDHCKLIMYYATNVRLGNSLDMMFAFPKDVFPDEPKGYYVKVVRHYADGTISEKDYSYLNDQWSVTTNLIYITYTGIAAKEMCDTIEVTVYKGDEAVSVTWEDSIRDYAMRLLEKHESNEKLRTLLVDMLNYGTACQAYLENYGGDVLANGLLNETQQGYASKAQTYTSSDASRPGWKAGQLVVESNILYNIIFDASLTYEGQTLDTKDLYVRYSYTGHKGNREVISERVKISDMATVVIDGVTYRYIPIAKMVVADAAKPDFAITITITDQTENTVYAQWTDSLRDYTARNAESDPVYGLFMQFAESAYTYLHSNERID